MNARITRFPTEKGQPILKDEGVSYSTRHQDAITELRFSSRADNICISMEEYRPESNRTTGASISIPRELWNDFKKQMLEYDGSTL